MMFFMQKKQKYMYILLISDNGLGDYFLVRNYFKYFKKSQKYKNHKIIFLAKPDRIDCVKKFDRDFIDVIIPFSPFNFENDKKYQNKLKNKLKSYNITDIINIGCAFPEIDNEPNSTAIICNYINAENKIAHAIEPNNEELKDKYNFYTEVIYTPNKDIFEFKRNKLFFEQLLKMDIKEPEIPYFESKKTHSDTVIGISPFKRDGYLSWSLEKWAELSNLIIDKFQNCKIAILGTTQDKKYYSNFVKRIKDKQKIINKIGKCKSSDLPNLISSFTLLISAETATVHIASAVNTPVVCLSNGGFYKRFHPIPSDSISYVYPKEFNIWKESYNEDKTINQYCYRSPFNLNDVATKTVYDSVLRYLK